MPANRPVFARLIPGWASKNCAEIPGVWTRNGQWERAGIRLTPREAESPDIPEAVIVHALRYVASRLGQDALDRGDYRRGRNQALGEERARLG